MEREPNGEHLIAQREEVYVRPSLNRRLLAWWLLVLLVTWPAVAAKRKLPKPGFNLFSVEQDIEIGKAGAQEVEKKVKLVTDEEVNRYIQTIGKKLASTPYAGKFPYSFKVVHDDSINAFALPGGPTYVNTGLILAAENEAQLAGVIGHEIAHVALRHGTNQVSKANFIQLAAVIGSSLLGSGSITSELARLGISFGASSLLLKYSRTAERHADILGAYMMNAAGYNPVEMARFFETLEAKTGRRGKIAAFFSSHPNPGNRRQRIEEEVQYMPRREYQADTGRLPRIQELVRALGKSAPESESRGTGEPQPKQSGAGGLPTGGVLTRPPQIVRPSPTHRTYQGRGFTFDYPDNWRLFAERNGSTVTAAPADAISEQPGKGRLIARGVMVVHLSDRRLQNVDLKQATRLLIEELKSQNPSLRVVDRTPTSLTIDGRPGLLTTLFSDSPYQGETEIDLLVTVRTTQGLLYGVFVSPQRDFRALQPTFERILKSIRITN